jgi:hypothetical protein
MMLSSNSKSRPAQALRLPFPKRSLDIHAKNPLFQPQVESSFSYLITVFEYINYCILENLFWDMFDMTFTP